ncbi:MAG: PAS domain S-box protein [Nanoarchaeota archaeon]
MKIRTIIILTFIFVGLIGGAFASYYFFINASDIVRKEVDDHLRTAAENKAGYLNDYLAHRKGDLAILSKSPSIRDALNQKLNSDVAAAKKEIKETAFRVAKEVDDYLKKNPTKTLKELQKDPVFQKIAVQPVGETGYTALTDYNTLVARFHSNPKIVDLDLSKLSETLPGFWSIMFKTKGGKDAEGVYDWEETDGRIEKKYMYIHVIGTKTADGVGLHVAATTYLGEYPSTMQLLIDAEDYLINFVESRQFKDLLLVTTEGKIWWTATKKHIGIDMKENNINGSLLLRSYDDAKKGMITISDMEDNPIDNELSMYVSAPVYGMDKDNIIGVAIVELAISQINNILYEYTGLDSSGETYLVGKDMLMRSDSKFTDEITILKQTVDTEPVRKCLEHIEILERGESITQENMLPVTIHDDYRGKLVIGTHSHIDEPRLCLIAEIDESEAIGYGRQRLLNISILVMIFISFGILIAGNMLSEYISKPINDLAKDVSEITKGKLDIHLTKGKIFEISALTDSLNRILASLKLAILKVGIKKEELGIGEVLKAKEVAEKKAQTYFDLAGNVMVALDKEGKITDLNKKGYEILGYEEGSLQGKDWFEIVIPKEEIESVKKIHVSNMDAKSKLVENFENLIMTKKGEKKVISWTNTLLKDDKGEIIGILSSGEDITGKKASEEILKKKTAELERFAKLSVGREEAMIELKKKLAAYEGKVVKKAILIKKTNGKMNNS